MDVAPPEPWMGAAGSGGAPVEIIRTLDALDRKIAECEAAAAISDDALRAVFPTFRMDFIEGAPADPFSDEYRAFQLALYARIAGKPYATANEASVVDVDTWQRPFPYSTRSPLTTGRHLGAIAFLLRTLDLPPGARVLEYGPGWGETTIMLAKLGMRVTAVEIEARFCEGLRRRAAHEAVAIEVIEGDFFLAETVAEPFDAVLFFECFHHCDDHMRLLRALRAAVVPGGAVIFAAEPILDGYPIPWGLRVDPEAVWAIRRFGWLELGYNETYFNEALARTGWSAVKHKSLDLPWIQIWTARQGSGSAAPAIEVAGTEPEPVTVAAAPPAPVVVRPRWRETLRPRTRWRAVLRAIRSGR